MCIAQTRYEDLSVNLVETYRIPPGLCQICFKRGKLDKSLLIFIAGLKTVN
jgi:hypothetical protein